MTRIEYIFSQYANILDWYKQSESKSNFLVTVNTLVVGVVNGLVFVGADKIIHAKNLYAGSNYVWLLAGLCGLSLVGSYLFILRAVWARHRGEVIELADKEKLWFFGHVASMSRDQHKKLVAGWSKANMEATMVAQNYILSRNVKTKYDSLNVAISLTIVALILLFCLGIAYAVAVANYSPPPAGMGAR